jgi:hypothetical protein
MFYYDTTCGDVMNISSLAINKSYRYKQYVAESHQDGLAIKFHVALDKSMIHAGSNL